ncbi:AraC family transcriptional regulator [Chitinophaga agrisoli]|uniref:AraC family transcriptional regulator n=1 Tax=Chitinophaga agrisoli TaxID=2607653 RepID=A0A5B2VPR8_9BACT|nr:AraC family transcriptional regulator [Chitinophaga agrisoli]KAA2240710.1 AraC family transcriptional regulator [Chitinophaga agrisoli]
MEKEPEQTPYIFQSISELNAALGLPKPRHPLIDLVNYKDITADTTALSKALVLNFYKVSFKRNLKGKVKYGQGYYDFDEGGLSFVSPNQLISAGAEDQDYEGFTLLFHPDFIRNYPLGSSIKRYGFFSYAVAEALYLSEKEKGIIISVFENIQQELSTSIDHFSQDVLVSQVELLLNYSNRFYNRQFITRKAVHSDLLLEMEKIMAAYFDNGEALMKGPPTVPQIAERLSVSPRYLSDMLRQLTGRNTQQHIQDMIIEKAKEILSTTNLSIAEIAYGLGFEHPQSFNRIFKRKTQVSPVTFRQSFKNP